MARKRPAIAPGAEVRYGPITAVLGERFKTFGADLPQDVQDAWWQRTDFGWTCSVCPNMASVNWAALNEAEADGRKHATEHGSTNVVKVG